jgi:hypothetical protein
MQEHFHSTKTLYQNYLGESKVFIRLSFHTPAGLNEEEFEHGRRSKESCVGITDGVDQAESEMTECTGRFSSSSVSPPPFISVLCEYDPKPYSKVNKRIEAFSCRLRWRKRRGSKSL